MNPLLATVGGISGVISTLRSLAVPPDVIEGIIKVLQREQNELEESQFNPVPATWFGNRSSGQVLGDHTDKAHARLSNSILEAVASLQGTEHAIVKFDRELEDADVNSRTATTALLNNVQQAVDQLDDNRHTPPAPTPPGSDT